MKSRYLAVIFIIQAIHAYFAWPNDLFFKTTLFSVYAIMIALAPIFFVSIRFQGVKAFIIGGISGVAMTFVSGMFLTQMERFPVIGWLLWLLINTVVFLMTGAGCWLVSEINKRYRWAYVLIAPLIYTSFNFLHNQLIEFLWFIPPPNITPVFSLTGFLPLVQMASITGIVGPVFLITFLIALPVFYLYEKALQNERSRAWLNVRLKVQPLKPDEKRKSNVTVLIVGGLVILLVILGNLDAAKVNKMQENTDMFARPALVQTNYDVSKELKWDRRTELRTTHIIRELILDAAKQEPDFLQFTENAIPGYLPTSVRLWEDLKSVFEEVNIPAIIGIVSLAGPKKNFNIWYHVDSNGKVKDYYIKRYLIPFGEYLPMRRFFNMLGNLFGSSENAIAPIATLEYSAEGLTSGSEERIFNILGSNVFVKTCDEIFIARYFREGVKKGGEFVMSPSTSNWFDAPANFYQNVAMTQIRAIESRRWIGRVSSMGAAVFVDAVGRVRAESEYNKKAVLVHKVPLLTYKSIYVKYGELFGMIILLLTLGFIGLTIYKNRKM